MKKTPEEAALDNEYWLGQFHAFDRMLNYLQTLDHQLIDRAQLYKEVHSWRPKKREDR